MKILCIHSEENYSWKNCGTMESYLLWSMYYSAINNIIQEVKDENSHDIINATVIS